MKYAISNHTQTTHLVSISTKNRLRGTQKLIINAIMDKKKEILTVPSEKNFSLSKVKLAKNGGIDVHYEVVEVVGNESYCNKYHVESAKDIHPDLMTLFKNLRPIMARLFNITSFLTLVETDDFKATKKQKDIARDFADEEMQNIEVRGVSFSGADDNVGVVLTGLFTFSNGQKAAINSPRIKFDLFKFGFEDELEQICEEIEKETYLFLFKGKKAQLELFGADGEPTPQANTEDEEEYNDPALSGEY